MPSKVDEMKKQLSKLTAKGDLLYYALADLAGSLSEGSKKILAEKKIDLPSFEAEYEPWYSEALLVVKQVLPDRVDDFVKQYKNEKRKEIDYLTYTISDALNWALTVDKHNKSFQFVPAFGLHRPPLSGVVYCWR